MSQASAKTDWSEEGIGTCACGQERRLWRPVSFSDSAMCWECIRRWLRKHEPQDPLRESDEVGAKKAVHWRERRRQHIADGRCVTCVRRPAMVGQQCYGCHNKSSQGGRKNGIH